MACEFRDNGHCYIYTYWITGQLEITGGDLDESDLCYVYGKNFGIYLISLLVLYFCLYVTLIPIFLDQFCEYNNTLTT